MEKPEKERQSLELHDSPDIEVAEEMVDDEPQNQEEPVSRLQDDQTVEAETKDETSVDLADNTNLKSGQPKVVQCEESMQNVPEELTATIGMGRETVTGECQKQGNIQATAQMTVDAKTEETSKPSKVIEYTLSIGRIVEEVMRFVPAEHTKSPIIEETKGSEGNEGIPERIEEQQNVPTPERDLEVGRNLEQGEQELQVRQVEQAVEFVLEEAVICDAKQEPMEEAEDIEEPQKYAFREKDKE